MSESMKEMMTPVRVAVVQFDPQVGIANRERNLGHSLSLAPKGGRLGCEPHPLSTPPPLLDETSKCMASHLKMTATHA
ncbi:hypothetical protein D9M68_530250 [compost metagenome]